MSGFGKLSKSAPAGVVYFPNPSVGSGSDWSHLFPSLYPLESRLHHTYTYTYTPDSLQTIRDIRVSSRSNVALTASMDKRLTLTSLDSGACIHSLLLPVPVWSCDWSRTDGDNVFYCGLSNGSVLGFDTRRLNAPVSVLCPIGGPPVHSLLSHPTSAMLLAASAGEMRCILKPMTEDKV